MSVEGGGGGGGDQQPGAGNYPFLRPKSEILPRLMGILDQRGERHERLYREDAQKAHAYGLKLLAGPEKTASKEAKYGEYIRVNNVQQPVMPLRSLLHNGKWTADIARDPPVALYNNKYHPFLEEIPDRIYGVAEALGPGVRKQEVKMQANLQFDLRRDVLDACFVTGDAQVAVRNIPQGRGQDQMVASGTQQQQQQQPLALRGGGSDGTVTDSQALAAVLNVANSNQSNTFQIFMGGSQHQHFHNANGGAAVPNINNYDEDRLMARFGRRIDEAGTNIMGQVRQEVQAGTDTILQSATRPRRPPTSARHARSVGGGGGDGGNDDDFSAGNNDDLGAGSDGDLSADDATRPELDELVRNFGDGDSGIEVLDPITQGLAVAKSLENPSADHTYMLENLAIIEKANPGFLKKLLRNVHQLSRESDQFNDLAWTDLVALTGDSRQNRPGMIFLADQDGTIVIYNEALFLRDALENVVPVVLPLLGFSDQHTISFGKAQIVISWKDTADALVVANVVQGILLNAIRKADQESEDNEEEEKIVVEVLGGAKSNLGKAEWILDMDVLKNAISDSSETFLLFNKFVFTANHQQSLLNVAANVVLNYCDLENGGEALVDTIFADKGRLTELHLVGSLPFSVRALERILMESHTKASSWVQLAFYSGAFSNLYGMKELMEKLKREAASYLFTSQMDRWKFCMGQDFSSESYSSSEQQWLRAFTEEALQCALHKKKSKNNFDDLKLRIKQNLADEDIADIEAWPIDIEGCSPHFVAMVSHFVDNVSFRTATSGDGQGDEAQVVDGETDPSVGPDEADASTEAENGDTGNAGYPVAPKENATFNDPEGLVADNCESMVDETSEASGDATIDNAADNVALPDAPDLQPPFNGGENDDENDAPQPRRSRRFKEQPEFGPLPDSTRRRGRGNRRN